QPIILVADDRVANHALLAELLQTEGYQVVSAFDGDQALRILLTQHIDIALLDVVMPGRTGFAVCRAVRERPETRLLPVILVTGLNNVEDRVMGIECGADDFLSKPVNREELLARVRS